LSNLLINEEPLQVLPGLAKAIGLNEAIILQQIHYWLKRSDKKHEGRTWTYNSYPEWKKQFPFWSESSIKRTFQSLEQKGLLITGNFNRMAIDRTKWYTINYSRLDEISPPSGQYEPMEKVKLTSPIPEITTENNSNIYTIFEFWNNTKVLVHRKMSDKLRGHINASLSNYSVEEICKAITNYSVVVKGEQYYWTHKWRLDEFLLRGLDKFSDENEPLKNFIDKAKAKTEIQPKSTEDKSREIIARQMEAIRKKKESEKRDS